VSWRSIGYLLCNTKILAYKRVSQREEESNLELGFHWRYYFKKSLGLSGGFEWSFSGLLQLLGDSVKANEVTSAYSIISQVLQTFLA
jgi:hypothetical protein